MLFESSVIFNAIKEKTPDTPNKTLAVIYADTDKINLKNDKDQTYFHLIAHCYESDEDAVALIPVVFQLSNAGLDVNALDVDGNTALHVAAKTPGSRRLIRAFILIGMDINVRNRHNQTPFKLAKPYPENAKVFQCFESDLWTAIEGRATDTVEKLAVNWCKINQSKQDKSIAQLSTEVGNNSIKKYLAENENTNEFVHYCLAGDRMKMRPFFKRTDININAVSSLCIDFGSGETVSLSVLGEAALLGLTSVVRKLLRKKATIENVVQKKSLFLYVLENIPPTQKFFEIIGILADKVNFSKNKKETHAILDAVYEKRLPIDVLRILTANGLDVFAADGEGHFLRDRILIKKSQETPQKLEDELAYVDNILIDMAKTGCIDIFDVLTNKSYDYIDVATKESGSVQMGLSKTLGNEKASTFIEDALKQQHLFRELQRVIEVGHLAQVQKLITPKVLRMKDRVGRTLVHKAVLYERRHVLRHLIKMNPKIARERDNFGRSPLFYACLVEDSKDITSALIVLGCKMDDEDEEGESPSSVMNLSVQEKEAKLKTERKIDYGMDTFIFFKYLDMKEAIRAGSLDRVEEVRGQIYKDIFINDLMNKMYQTDPPQRCLLQFAVDAKRDDIARYLLTLGIDWDVTYNDGTGPITLLQAAADRNMEKTVSYIRFQIEKQDKHHELLKKLKNKGVVKNVKNNSTNQKVDNQDKQSSENGSSCAVQ